MLATCLLLSVLSVTVCYCLLLYGAQDQLAMLAERAFPRFDKTLVPPHLPPAVRAAMSTPPQKVSAVGLFYI